MSDNNRALKVFLCHAHSDKEAVKALYARLKREGVDVWLDKEKLLPGADWEYEIRKAVREADVVVVCLSKQFNQAGFRQKEVRIALDAAMEKPEGEIFIIPARLEECETLESLSKWHWVDLFEVDGYQMFMRALRVRAEKIGATLPQRSVPRPKIKDEQKAAREKAEKDAAEKTRLEAEELERRRIAKEQADRETAKKTAREKAEKDAHEKAAREKARLEAEEAEKRRLAKEKADRKAAREKAEREAVEKARLEAEKLAKRKATKEKAEREEIETKPEIQKSQDNSSAMLWVVGGILVIILVVWLSSLNGTPSVPAPTSIPATLPKVLASNTNTLTSTPKAIVLPSQTLLPTKISTPTAYAGSLPIEITDDKGVTMRLVPAGEFTMGSENSSDDKKPVHQVYLDDFYMDTYEVTNALYKACVTAGVCKPPKDEDTTNYYGYLKYENHPVVGVDWSQAQAYCQWRGASLPTEAQWEKSARGTDERTYPWGNTFDGTKVNFCDKNCSFDWADKTVDDGFAGIAPVGSYENGKSPYGIYDLAGNVSEWTADWYSETYYQNSPSSNPLGPDSGTQRVLRGGINSDQEEAQRTYSRPWRASPDYFSFNYGFRCARSLP